MSEFTPMTDAELEGIRQRNSKLPEAAAWLTGEDWDLMYQLASTDIPRLLDEMRRLREAQRWIPVGERMPDENVIVFFRRGTTYPHVGFLERPDRWQTLEHWRMDAAAVDYWRPLPDPPQAANDEGSK